MEGRVAVPACGAVGRLRPCSEVEEGSRRAAAVACGAADDSSLRAEAVGVPLLGRACRRRPEGGEVRRPGGEAAAAAVAAADHPGTAAEEQRASRGNALLVLRVVRGVFDKIEFIYIKAKTYVSDGALFYTHG